MKKCFGIVSWLPDKESARKQRITRVNKLLRRIEELWPDIDILIIAQNWKDYKPTKVANKLNVIKFDEGLGILRARKTLRKEFLKLGYDYLIMLDDDALIEIDSDDAAKVFMADIDKHKDGFCFIPDRVKNDWYIPYASAQLNLCAISKFILEKEDIPNVDPQKNEAYEDGIYAALLHFKYAYYEFIPTTHIWCSQFKNKKEPVPSTWSGVPGLDYKLLSKHYNDILRYISKNKELPNLELYFKYETMLPKTATRKDVPGLEKEEVKPLPHTKPKKLADGRKDCYLYF